MTALHDTEVDAQIESQIDTTNLEAEFTQLPALLAYHNERYADAFRVYLMARETRKQAEANAAQGARIANPKATVGAIEAEVDLSEDVHNARLQEIAAEADKARLFGRVDALRARKECLISLGAHIRATELSGDPVIRQRNYLEREMRNNQELPTDIVEGIARSKLGRE